MVHRIPDPDRYALVDGIYVPRIQGGAGFSFVQGAGGGTTSTWTSGTGNTAELSTAGTSLALTAFASNNTLGNLLVLVACSWNSTGASVSSVTDTAGNTWSSGSSFSTGVLGSGNSIDFWWVNNCKGSANTVTVHYGASVFVSACCLEYSGNPTAITLLSSNSGDAVTSPASLSFPVVLPVGCLTFHAWNDQNSGGTYSINADTLRADAVSNLTTAISENVNLGGGFDAVALTSNATGSFAIGCIALGQAAAVTFEATLLPHQMIDPRLVPV